MLTSNSYCCFSRLQWMLFMIPTCLAHGAMSVYGIMLQNDVYAIAKRRRDEVQF